MTAVAHRAEREWGRYNVVVSIDRRGVAVAYFVVRDHGEVVERWTEGDYERHKRKVEIVGALLAEARAAELESKRKAENDNGA